MSDKPNVLSQGVSEPELEKAISELLTHFYAQAVAVHESIKAGFGATEWQDEDNAARLRSFALSVRKGLEAQVADLEERWERLASAAKATLDGSLLYRIYGWEGLQAALEAWDRRSR